MQNILGLASWYLGIYLVVAVHEFGHYIFAKAMKFRCSGLTVGIGPALFNKEISGTKFSLKLIPLGGACTFDDFTKTHEKGENVRGFYLKKALIIFAGPLFNFVLAFVLMLCVNNIEGLRITAVNDPQLRAVSICEGDIIHGINDIRIYSENDIQELLVVGAENTITYLNSNYEKVTVSFFCDNTDLDVTYDNCPDSKVIGAYRNCRKLIDIGVSLVEETVSKDKLEVFDYGKLYAGFDHDIAKPFRLSKIYIEAATITSMLTMALGFMNLLPVMFFDGFKIVVSLLCAALNRDLPKGVEIITGVGITAVFFFRYLMG